MSEVGRSKGLDGAICRPVPDRWCSLKIPYRDGMTHIVMLDFMQRLAGQGEGRHLLRIHRVV